MPLSTALRRLLPRLLAGCLVGLLVAGDLGAADSDLERQRVAFRQAYAVAQRGGDGWRSWAKGLPDYPIYPYLEAAALTHDLRQLDMVAVQGYLTRYPDAIPADDLRRAFLLELARREDWAGFRTLYRPGLGDALTCDALRAKSADGIPLTFEHDLAALWAKPSLPNACDEVLEDAHVQGLLTSTRLWARIDRAIAAGQGGTVALLAGWLDGDSREAAQQLAQALRDPAAATAAAANWTDTPRHRQAAALALQRLARRQSMTADTSWQALQARFDFTPAQRDAVLYALALYHATDFDDAALARLAALPASAQTDASREWRVRVALARQEWPQVLAAIAAMPVSQQQQTEWRYFKARALEADGNASSARSLYADVAGDTGYFGFLAADRSGSDYSICPLAPPEDAQRQRSLAADDGLRRAFELYAVGLPRYARREWSRALDGADPATLRAAAELAYAQGWYDRAVFTFTSGQSLRYYDRRFPLASQDGVVPQAREAGIDPAWAYAIARAESAWMSDARSGADARGLMQLLPSTAALVARRNGLDYSGADSLYDPATNISLGTRYLAQMAERFDGAPWLASGAYNAGPGKIDQWLDQRGSLAPDLFVATMPFKETREYVARVMAFAVIYDWRLHGRPLAMSTRMPPSGQAYALPTAGTLRRNVVCSAPSPRDAVPASADTASPPAASASSTTPAAAATAVRVPADGGAR